MIKNLLILVATILLVAHCAPLQIRQDSYDGNDCTGRSYPGIIPLNVCYPGINVAASTQVSPG